MRNEQLGEQFKVLFFVDFKMHDIVYIKTDTEQRPCMITGFMFSGEENEIVYELTQSQYVLNKYFSAMELSKTKDIILTSTN